MMAKTLRSGSLILVMGCGLALAAPDKPEWQIVKTAHPTTDVVVAGFKDLSIWYPGQTPDNIVPYPFCLIQAGGDNATFENLTLVNPYQGIRIGPGGNELHDIHNVYGTPLKVGVQYDSTTDIGRLENIHFSPAYWSASQLPGAPEPGGAHERWLLENGTGLHMLRSDWEYVAYITVEGYNRGFFVSEGVRGAANAQFYSLIIRNCRTVRAAAVFVFQDVRKPAPVWLASGFEDTGTRLLLGPWNVGKVVSSVKVDGKPAFLLCAVWRRDVSSAGRAGSLSGTQRP
jgi:hypothetical protein